MAPLVREDQQLLTPGVAVPLRFAMLPTSYVVPAGHRVQVTVTGYDPRETGVLPDAHGSVLEVLSPSSVTLPLGGTR